jgi:hypothetical protein
VRIAEFHGAAGVPIALVRPLGDSPLYLRSVPEEEEYEIAENASTVEIRSLSPARPGIQARGAAHHAFKFIFSDPFDRSWYAQFTLPAPEAELRETLPAPSATQRIWAHRRPVGWASLGVAAVCTGVATAFTLSASSSQSEASASTSQARVVEINNEIGRKNAWARGAWIGAGSTALVGALLLLWPDTHVRISAAPATGGASIAWSSAFP